MEEEEGAQEGPAAEHEAPGGIEHAGPRNGRGPDREPWRRLAGEGRRALANHPPFLLAALADEWRGRGPMAESGGFPRAVRDGWRGRRLGWAEARVAARRHGRQWRTGAQAGRLLRGRRWLRGGLAAFPQPEATVETAGAGGGGEGAWPERGGAGRRGVARRLPGCGRGLWAGQR